MYNVIQCIVLHTNMYILFDGLTYNMRRYFARCYFASILFGKGCLKQMDHLFFRVGVNDVNSTKSQLKTLYLMG